jgi:hypothetical protein
MRPLVVERLLEYTELVAPVAAIICPVTSGKQ